MTTLARLVAALLLLALGFGALAQDADTGSTAANQTAAAEQAAPAPAADSGGSQFTAYSEGMGPVSRMFFPSQASTHARETDAIMFFIFWVSVFFFVLLMGLIVYFSVKYRRRPGVPQQRSMSHNTPLELTWSIIPTLLMAVMFVWGFKVYMEMHTVPAGAETINVTAQKWAWNFEYDDGSSSRELTDPILGIQYPVYAVPIGRPVRLLMQSTDVIHSLYVPAFRHKIDIFPNRYTVYMFTAEEVGSYQLFCAEYCGDQHSQMMAEIRVLSDSDYRAWRAEQSNTDDIPLPELGETLRLTKGCVQCHTVDGSPLTGPSWKDIFGETRQFTDGSSATIDENYIRESILYPGNKIVSGYPNQMPSYAGQLKEREIRAFVAYIASLSTSGQEALEQMMEADEAGKEAAEPAGPDAALPVNTDNALAASDTN